MKMSTFVVVMAVLTCAACGAFKSPLEKEYDKLKAETQATESAVAEELYNKTEKFATRVGKTKGAPAGLLAKARELQQQRAREFTIAAAKDWDFGSARKVFRALTGSGLDPEVEAKQAGVDPEKLKETPAKEQKERKFLKSDDAKDWK